MTWSGWQKSAGSSVMIRWINKGSSRGMCGQDPPSPAKISPVLSQAKLSRSGESSDDGFQQGNRSEHVPGNRRGICRGENRCSVGSLHSLQEGGLSSGASGGHKGPQTPSKEGVRYVRVVEVVPWAQAISGVSCPHHSSQGLRCQGGRQITLLDGGNAHFRFCSKIFNL